MIVTREKVTEVDPHRFVSEASTLGFKAGEWPASLFTDLGNGERFWSYEVERDDDDDVVSVRYRQDCGIIELRVFND